MTNRPKSDRPSDCCRKPKLLILNGFGRFGLFGRSFGKTENSELHHPLDGGWGCGTRAADGRCSGVSAPAPLSFFRLKRERNRPNSPNSPKPIKINDLVFRQQSDNSPTTVRNCSRRLAQTGAATAQPCHQKGPSMIEIDFTTTQMDERPYAFVFRDLTRNPEIHRPSSYLIDRQSSAHFSAPGELRPSAVIVRGRRYRVGMHNGRLCITIGRMSNGEIALWDGKRRTITPDVWIPNTPAPAIAIAAEMLRLEHFRGMRFRLPFAV
jgi:hypothetical protein